MINFRALVCLFFGFCLIGCAAAPLPTTYTVYLTRHFEKAKLVKDPELTARGLRQAEVFASLLDNKPISTIYSTDYRRTIQSASALASALNQSIQKYNPREPEVLIARVLNNASDQVVVGHSNTIPDLVNRLGGKSQAIAESEYGVVFAVSITLLDGVRIDTSTREILLLEGISE